MQLEYLVTFVLSSDLVEVSIHSEFLHTVSRVHCDGATDPAPGCW